MDTLFIIIVSIAGTISLFFIYVAIWNFVNTFNKIKKDILEQRQTIEDLQKDVIYYRLRIKFHNKLDFAYNLSNTPLPNNPWQQYYKQLDETYKKEMRQYFTDDEWKYLFEHNPKNVTIRYNYFATQQEKKS